MHCLDGISDHDLVIVKFAYDITPPVQTTRKYVRKPSACTVDPDVFGDDLKAQLFDFPASSNASAQVDQLATCIGTVLNNHAPKRVVRPPAFSKPKPHPWLTDRLKYLHQQRIHLHRKVRAHPAEQQLLQKYRAVRREGTLLNKKLKSEYYVKQFRDRRRDPRGQRALLNSLSGRQQVRVVPAASISDLTETFADIVHDPSRPEVLLLPAPAAAEVFTDFLPVSVETVSDVLKSLNPAKATGSDDIPPCLMKSCRLTIAGPLTVVINQSLRSGVFPDMYKHAHVCPLFKSGDKAYAANYRTISLLPIAAKVLEKVVHKQVTDFFKHNPDHPAIPREQFAYRPNHSCEDALTLCIDKWNRAVDSGQQCGVVFADMSKAFDRVKHSLLTKELAEVGLGGTVLHWFSDYLSRRSQRVVFNDVKGSIRSCTRGVPQGSVLGPLLFSIYIRHVPSIFTHSVPQLYADDIAFYIIGRHIPAIMQQLQADLSALALHLDERGLVLNPTKTQFLLLRRPNTPGIDEEAYLTCKGSTIIPASTVKYLGILIDEHLTFRPQVKRVCSAVFGKLAAFKHGRRNLSLFAKRTFYLSIIQSTLDYASNSYVHSLGSRLFNRLVTVSHIAMKKVFGLDQMTPTVVVLRHYNLYSFEQRINLKLYVFV